MHACRNVVIVQGIVCAIFLMVVIIAMSHDADRAVKRLRVEAVQHGYAEWVLSDEGVTEFRWKEKKP